MSNQIACYQSTSEVVSRPIRYSFFKSIHAAAGDWDAAAPVHDVFLQRAYLEVLEKTPPQGMRFAYAIFYREEIPIGVAYFQIKYFKGDDNIRDLNTNERKEPCFFDALSTWLKKKIASQVAADILILGNMLLTGEHGYHFDYQQIREEDALETLDKCSRQLLEDMQQEGVKMPVVLVKDVAPENRRHGQFFEEKKFTEFEIQPNMVLKNRWQNFDEYLQNMTTKYRTRAKRAFKKLDGIEKRELSHADMVHHLPKIYELYSEIARNAGFNMVDLNENYLVALKKDLPDIFRAFGYFQGGRLVAFFTTIQNGDELEAHFLGFEKSMNHDFQLYLNILYDIVRLGIEAGVHQIIFARTALEIKSSVGAVPTDLYCYLRHRSRFANQFTETMLDYLKPVEIWEQRHPFKEG